MAAIRGSDLVEVETPALWVDLDLFESNVQRLADYFRAAGVSWRPHFKGLRVPALAHKQIEAGAIGVTCSKVSEAEAAVAGGIPSVLIANQMVTASRIARVISLAKLGKEVIASVDSLRNAQDLSRAALESGIKLPVVVEVDLGMKRCGVLPGKPAVELARQVSQAEGLVLKGLLGYEGHTEVIEDPQDKKRAVEESVGLLVDTARGCVAEGLAMEIVSAGGSATYRFTAHIAGVTEIQAGGASFMDVIYDSLGVNLDFSLFVRSTIISRAETTRAVADAGRKWMGCVYFVPAPDSLRLTWSPCPVAMPRPVPAGVQLQALHAEHSLLKLAETVDLGVGDQIDFVVGYVDFTVMNFDRLYGVRRGKLEAVWDILGRGI